MSLVPKSKAGRAYTRRLLLAMTAYVLLLSVAIHALQRPAPSHAAAIFFSVLPAIPILAVLVSVGLYLRDERDEFEREKLIQSMLWGIGGTLAVTSVWGFLENFHQAPHFPAFYVFMLFWFFVGICGCVQYFRYRVTADE